MLYILDEENNPVEVNAIAKWESWMETNQQKVHLGKDTIGEITISTVFIGVDGMAHARPAPLLFESTVLDDCDDIMEVKVYTSYEDALQSHKNLIKEYKFGSN